jgi:hypothetical protein
MLGVLMKLTNEQGFYCLAGISAVFIRINVDLDGSVDIEDMLELE